MRAHPDNKMKAYFFFLCFVRTDQHCMPLCSYFRYWTLIPYVKLLCLPNSPKAFPHNPLFLKLQLLSIDIVLFFLHSKILREYHWDALGLIDFVHGMFLQNPGIGLETLCLNLVVISDCSHQLCATLPKAKLAKLCTGLERLWQSFH